MLGIPADFPYMPSSVSRMTLAFPDEEGVHLSQKACQCHLATQAWLALAAPGEVFLYFYLFSHRCIPIADSPPPLLPGPHFHLPSPQIHSSFASLQ